MPCSKSSRLHICYSGQRSPFCGTVHALPQVKLEGWPLILTMRVRLHPIRGSSDSIARGRDFCLLRRYDLSSTAVFLQRANSRQTCMSHNLNAACTALQARVRAITEIVTELQRGVKEGRDVNLNAIKRDVCCCRVSMIILSSSSEGNVRH